LRPCPLPNGRLYSNREAASGSPQRQHGGGPLVVSCGLSEKPQTSSCQLPWWERGRHPVVALTSTFVTYGDVIRILRSAHMLNASMRARALDRTLRGGPCIHTRQGLM